MRLAREIVKLCLVPPGVGTPSVLSRQISGIALCNWGKPPDLPPAETVLCLKKPAFFRIQRPGA